MSGKPRPKHIRAQALDGLSRDCVDIPPVTAVSTGGTSIRATVPALCVHNLGLEPGERLRYWVDEGDGVIEVVPERTATGEIRPAVFDRDADRMDDVGVVKLQDNKGQFCATVPADGCDLLDIDVGDELAVELHTERQTIRYIP